MLFNWAEKDVVESKLRSNCVYSVQIGQQLLDLIKQTYINKSSVVVHLRTRGRIQYLKDSGETWYTNNPRRNITKNRREYQGVTKELN